MKVGIIGSGNIGGALAKYLIDLGHDVVISNSRGPASLIEVADKTGARAVTAEEASKAEDLVIISVPENAVPNLPVGNLSVSKAIIVDTGNYYPTRDGKNADIDNGLTDSEWVEKVIGHPVIKAFNNIGVTSLEEKGVSKGNTNRIALSVAGDDAAAKKVVMDLIDDIGFDPVDTGSLAESWRQQPGEGSYCRDLSKEDLSAALQDADLNKRKENLAYADEIARPYL
ncbi:NADPH-dependent F420 reductase [Chryseobacterium terrae]|uniref:NAD(P)-binding domain-containing protein n=1 Tax=Chryseobacterium terrae TaxID=3163299 RepID=A0ABW8Y2Y1_9FLAO